eukprot:12874-Heterococcus_DN1.PRE.2
MQHHRRRSTALSAEQSSRSSSKGSAGGVLYFTGLSCATILISYADRSNLATAILPMSQQYDWSKSFEGTVLSAFYLGYALTQMLGGWLADKYGGRYTLAAGLTAWSVFTLLTPAAAALGSVPLLATRVALGLGEGFAFPSIHAMISEYVPVQRQATVVGAVTAASYGGAALAFGASPTLAQNYGWESIFYVFGGVSLLLTPAWLLFKPTYSSSTAAHDSIDDDCSSNSNNSANLELMPLTSAVHGDSDDDADSSSDVALTQHTSAALTSSSSSSASVSRDRDSAATAATATAAVPTVSLLQELKAYGARREVQAILIAQFTQSVSMAGLLSIQAISAAVWHAPDRCKSCWLPTYLHEVGGIELGDLGALAAAPYVLQRCNCVSATTALALIHRCTHLCCTTHAGVGAMSGILADDLTTNRNWSVKATRRWLQGIGMIGPAITLMLATTMSDSPNSALAQNTCCSMLHKSGIYTCNISLCCLSMWSVYSVVTADINVTSSITPTNLCSYLSLYLFMHCFCACSHLQLYIVIHSAALIAVGSALSALTLGGVSVSHLDIAPKRAGLVFGAGNVVVLQLRCADTLSAQRIIAAARVSSGPTYILHATFCSDRCMPQNCSCAHRAFRNTAGTLAGLFTVPASGWLVDTFYSWNLVLYMFAFSNVVGCAAWTAWCGGEEIIFTHAKVEDSDD